MAFKVRTETTFASLVEGDTLVDKNGNSWKCVEVKHDAESVTFWLADLADNVRKHLVAATPHEKTCTLIREPSRAEEIEQREAEVDAAAATPAEPVDEAEAVAVVEQVLGGAVLATETADHEAERNLARAGGPAMSLPAFAEFTDPEMRSHIFLVHGVYAHDVKTVKALVKMHDDLHDDEAGQHTAHDHDGAFA